MKYYLLFASCFLIFQVNLYSQLNYSSYFADRKIVVDGEITEWPNTPPHHIIYATDPNSGDLQAPDLELELKSLWRGDSIYFLFRRMDDSLVNGFIGNDPDLDLKEGLENRDATSLYLYLHRNDEDRAYEEREPDSLTFWISWVWGSDSVEARTSDGNITGDITDLFGAMEYSYTEPYYYTEIGIDLKQLIQNANPEDILEIEDSTYIGFDIELYENDKEIGSAPFGIQTRAFWGSYIWGDAKNQPSDWGTLIFRNNDTIIASVGNRPELAFGMYPNPACEFVSIESSFEIINYIRIVDFAGREVYSAAISDRRKMLNVSGIDAGVYIIQLFGEDGSVGQRKLLIY